MLEQILRAFKVELKAPLLVQQGSSPCLCAFSYRDSVGCLEPFASILLPKVRGLEPSPEAPRSTALESTFNKFLQ